MSSRHPHESPPRVVTLVAILVLLALGAAACTQAAAPGGSDTDPVIEATSAGAETNRTNRAGDVPATGGEPGGDPDSDEVAPAPDATEESGAVPTSAAAAMATELAASVLPDYVSSFGTSGSRPGELMLPFDVALDSQGDVYVSDSTGVQRFAPDGTFLAQIGQDEVLTALGGIAIGPDDTLYISGFESEVLAYGPDGAARGSIGEPGTDPGQLSRPVDVAVGGDGRVYVADADNARVEVFDAGGAHLLSIGAPGSERGQFRNPRAVALDVDGNVVVGEGDHFLIQRFAPDGTYIDTFGQSHADENIWRIGGLAVADDGMVYASQALANRIQAFDPARDMVLAWEFGSLGAGATEFSTPMGLTFSGGRLYVADQQNNRVVVYEPTE